MGRDRDQPWSYRYGDLTPSRPDQFGNPSLAGEPMIRLERVPAQSGFWHRERLQVVRTFPITPFHVHKILFPNATSTESRRAPRDGKALEASRTVPEAAPRRLAGCRIGRTLSMIIDVLTSNRHIRLEAIWPFFSRDSL